MFSIRLGFKGCSQILHGYILGYYEWSEGVYVYVLPLLAFFLYARPNVRKIVQTVEESDI